MDLAWARVIVEQCREARVPVFVKQLGAWIKRPAGALAVNQYLYANGDRFVPPMFGARMGQPSDPDYVAFSLFDRKGGDPSEWPVDLRMREFPK
jgi:hypothetical protein